MPDPTLDRVRGARPAARSIAPLDTESKNRVLRALAERIDSQRADILNANAQDMDAARIAGLSKPKLQRLSLTQASLEQLAQGLVQIAGLPDPVGAVTAERTVPSGLHVRRVRCPLGVVMMIYEARPAVTIDAFALCFKAGNACVLKGGKEAAHSNRCLGELARTTLREHGLPDDAMIPVTSSDRTLMQELLAMDDCIDLVIPRGGETLIRFVHEHSTIPTVLHFNGVCHLYIHADADIEQAVQLAITGTASAPATCNALECVLVHRDAAPVFLPALHAAAQRAGVELRGDDLARAHAPEMTPAQDDDWGAEYLDMILAVRVVDDLDAAVAHIDRFGSNHTEAIATRCNDTARAFTDRVQSSCVLVNASTRFNDGFQLGLGAEIGISTTRVHAYGPMGLEELTTQRYIVHGDGQTR